MANFTIPNNLKQIRQNNRSETVGELIETFNIDLNRKFGKLYPSKKLVKVLDQVTHLGNDIPVAFAIFNNNYYVAGDSDLFRCSTTVDPTDATNWSEVTTVTSGLDLDTDIVVFNNLLLMSSGGSAIYSLNTSGTFSNTWSSGKLTGLSAASQMHVHRGGQETLIVCNGTNVKYYNTTAGEFTVSLQSDLVATCVTSGIERVWVGTRSTSDGNAYVYEIVIGEVINVLDDAGAIVDTKPAARNAYKVEGSQVMSIEVIDNVPYIITEKGNIQAFNGAGFSTVASFPFANTTEVISDSSVHPKGMRLHNDSLYINISTRKRVAGIFSDYVENTPSGVWEFNSHTGQLNHRFSFSDNDSEKGARELDSSNNGPIIILDNEYALLLAGAEIGKVTGATAGVFADTGSPFGYFKTIEIESGTVQDVYERLYLKAKTLASGEDIKIKYRTTKKDRVVASCIAASATEMNTTDSVEGIDKNWVAVDLHSGVIAQVVSVTGSTTKQITLDSDFATAGQTRRVEFWNFKDVNSTYTTEDGEIKSWGDFGTNPWIQFLVILNGDIEFRQFLLKSNAKNEV